MKTNDELLEKCNTARQREIVSAYISCNYNIRETVRATGLSRSYVKDIVDKVTKDLSPTQPGFIPEDRHVPEGHNLIGLSTLTTNADGETQWVKTRADAKKQQDIMDEAAQAFVDKLKPAKIVPLKKRQRLDNLLNLYILTDYHIGMKAWGEETGADFDMKIAEKLLVNWFKEAITASPNAKSAVLGQLGDFLHWDGLEAVTPTSKHLLDADTRFQKLVRVTIRVIRQIIGMMLDKYDTVHVIMAEGNHDPAGSMWLREMLDAFYDNEPRLTVDTSPGNYYAVSHGKVALFFHHGHKRKPERIDDVFVAKYRELFGRTTYAYAHMGHLHHNKTLETNLMEVEQHQTLAAPDAYATHGGWMSGRSAKCISYDDEHGEVFRITLRPEMVVKDE